MNLVISAFQEPRWRRRAVRLTGRQAGRPAARRRHRHGQGRGRPPSPRAARWQRPRRRHLAGHDPRRAAGASATGRARLRRRRRAGPADRGRDVRRRHDRLRDAQPARLPARVRRDGPLGPARRAGRLPRDRPAEAAGSPASSSSGSTGSCRSSAAWPARAAPTATSSAASRATRARTGSPRSCARPGLEDVSWQGMTGGIVTLHVGTVPHAAEPTRAGWGRIPASMPEHCRVLAHPRPRPDQAVRRVHRRRRHRLRRRAAASRSASSGRTAPARPRRCG